MSHFHDFPHVPGVFHTSLVPVSKGTPVLVLPVECVFLYTLQCVKCEGNV